MKSTEYLRETRDDRSVTSRVVIKFKERSCDKLVVPRHREESFLWQGHEEETFVLLWVGAVSRFVGILRRFKVRSPPVGNNLVNVHTQKESTEIQCPR